MAKIHTLLLKKAATKTIHFGRGRRYLYSSYKGLPQYSGLDYSARLLTHIEIEKHGFTRSSVIVCMCFYLQIC